MMEALRGLLQIPSETGAEAVFDEEKGNMPYGEHVAAALEFVLDYCESLGFRTKNCDNRIGWAEIGSGDELIGILVHLDVVPAGGGWDYPPYDLTVDEDRMYGRGIADDKGPAICAIEAMNTLLDRGMPLHKRVRIIFGCQEETGDWEDMKYYCEHEELPTYGFTPDADFPAIYGEKGIVSMKAVYPIEGSGICKAEGGNAVNMVADTATITLDDGSVISEVGVSAHGSMPQDGENAIAKAMEKASEKSSFAKWYTENIGYTCHGEKLGLDFCDEQSGMLTMNVGTICTTEEKIELKIDIRYPVTLTMDVLSARIDEAFGGAGFKTEIYEQMDPVFMDKNGDVIQKLVEAFREETGMDAEPTVIGGGTYARAMPNIVAFGPILPGDPCTEHQPNEHISVESFETAVKIYTRALEKLVL